jgi:hypothetical protein
MGQYLSDNIGGWNSVCRALGALWLIVPQERLLEMAGFVVLIECELVLD